MRQLFLVYFFIGCATVTFGQQLLDTEVSVKFKGYDLERCLNQIEKASDITFSYNSKQIHQANKSVQKTFENTTLQAVLDYLLAGTQLQYKEIGEQITVYALTNTGEKVIVSGYVRDKKSGEELIGARVTFPEFGVGCVSNSYGYYALEVPKSKTYFRVSSLGMLALSDTVHIESQMVLNVELLEDTVLLHVVEVIKDSLGHVDKVSDLPSVYNTIITPNAISKVPAASGEQDLLRHIQQLPGIQPANDGGVNFMVRGSGTGDNLILLDEIPIYHPTHLLGIYSIINTDALRSATLYKDYIPLQYGTRSASVLHINTNEGNMNRHHISGGVSGFAGRLNVEGPIIKKKASFYTTGRVSTFPGALYGVLGNRNLGDPQFYDFNGKINIRLNSNNRIYLTGYYGNDRLRDSISDYRWGNKATSLRWNHIINTKTFSNLSIIHSEFAYGYDRYTYANNEETSAIFGQKVVTNKISYDITHFLTNSVRLNYGFSSGFLRTSKGNFSDKSANLFLNRMALENGVYASVEKKFNDKFKLNTGVRVPISFHVGTGDTTSFLNKNLTTTQVVYQKKKLYDPLFFIDPRLVLSYLLNDRDEIQFASIVTSQNTHIINYVTNFLPIEIWTPSNRFFKPKRNFQTSLGWTHLRENFQSSATIYYKYVTNVLDYASPIFTPSTDIESNLLPGTLRVYGLELMFNYKFTTWYSAAISYAYTNTRQKVPNINNDLPYVAAGDRPHFFSISQFFNFSKKWQITTNYIAHSGTAITLPNGQFTVDGTAFPLYSSQRNGERLPNFHRVDLAFRRQLGVKKKKNNWHVMFTVTNFFARYNPSVAYVENDPFNPSKLRIRSLDYSPFMLSLNLNFKF